MNEEAFPLRDHEPKMGHNDWCDIVTYLTDPSAELPSGYADKALRLNMLGQTLAANLSELDSTSEIFRALAKGNLGVKASFQERMGTEFFRDWVMEHKSSDDEAHATAMLDEPQVVELHDRVTSMESYSDILLALHWENPDDVRKLAARILRESRTEATTATTATTSTTE